MRRCTVVLAVLAAALCVRDVRAGDILNLGDPAPPLTVSGWVKGEKVDRFEARKTYVVEFWATWCGPCLKSIPHLTDLAHKYKAQGVRFVGVDVWEQDAAKVKPFVEEMGARMDYTVAVDDVSGSSDPNDGATANAWMKAAEESGIPTAFLVHDGKIAWIGHPNELDGPLAKVVAGEGDPTEPARERLAVKTKERKASVVREKVFPLYSVRDYRATVKAIDDAVLADRDLAGTFDWLKFASLCNGGEVEAGLAIGETLFEANKDNPFALNNFFWNTIDPDLKNEVDPRVARLALRATRRAVELDEDVNPNHLDTLAEALFRNGDAAGALATEERARKLVASRAKDPNATYLKAFDDRIERYRKAAETAERP